VDIAASKARWLGLVFIALAPVVNVDDHLQQTYLSLLPLSHDVSLEA
jgi:hypothetical protein